MNPAYRTEWWRPDFTVDQRRDAEAVPAAGPGARESAVPFWALICFTFVLLLAPQIHFPALAPLRPALLSAGLAVAAYLFDRFTRRRPLTIRSGELWLAACLAGWAILTVPLSYWPGGSVSFLFDIYFKSLVIFWLLANTLTSAGRIRQVFWALSLAGVPLAVVGVRNFLSGLFQPQAVIERITGYDAPLTANPNDLALMLILILPLSVALFLLHRRPIVRAALLAIIGLEAVAALLTFSRAGFLTLAMLFALYLWKFRGRPERKWVVAVLVPVLVCIPLLIPSYLERLATITDIESDQTGSAQERWGDMITAAKLVLQNPIIGSGVGQNTLALNQARGSLWKPIHNVYLEYAVDLGILGLVLFLMLLVGCIRSAALAQRRSNRMPALRELFYLSEGIQISLLAFAAAAFFYPVGYQFYFYYLAGLAIAAKSIRESEERKQFGNFDRTGLH